MAARLHPTVGRLIRYGISAVIIVLLIAFARTVDWHAAWHAMRNADPQLLAVAIIVNLLSLLARGVRWWILLRAAGAPSFGVAFRATVAGAGLNNILIANGGEAARLVFVMRANRISSSRLLATVALDRIFDPVGFVLLLAAGPLLFQLPPQLERLRWPALSAALVLGAVMVWLASRARTMEPAHIPERRAEPRGWKAKLRAWMGELGISMRDLATGSRLLWVVLLTIAAWLLQLATFACAAAAAHVKLPLAGSLTALLAVNVSLIVRPTPGNVGFFQLAYALATEPFGVSKESAIAVSLLIQTLQIIPVTLLGVALAPEFLLRRGVSVQEPG